MLNSDDFMLRTAPRQAAAGAAMPHNASTHAKMDGAGAGIRTAPPAHVALPDSRSGLALRDWDVPFGVLEARLGSMAGEQECMAALGQLRTALAHELARCQQLELKVFDAQAGLAQLRAELAGTQAGERRARHLAMHDGLTSLPNRSFFRQQLGLALAHLEPRRPAFAVLYLDLDGFKPINDTHGHTIGDELLRIVAARLSQAVRAEDMVSRLGGDEFACLMADLLDREQLSRLAVKLVDTVSAPLMIGRLKLSVRPSIGIAICPTDGATADTLLENADAAMYRAKRHRTGYAFVD
jgi:diguanylate cyclase (GGDEF)-like protein